MSQPVLMWKEGCAYIIPKVRSLKSGMKRPGTGKQHNSSISETSGNHGDKPGHVELGHILLYLFISMIPSPRRGTARITWSPSGLHSIIQGGLQPYNLSII